MEASDGNRPPVFLTLQQEALWKRKWLICTLDKLKKRLSRIDSELDSQISPTEKPSFEPCSRIRPPSHEKPDIVILNPVDYGRPSPAQFISWINAAISPILSTQEEYAIHEYQYDGSIEENSGNSNESMMKVVDDNIEEERNNDDLLITGCFDDESYHNDFLEVESVDSEKNHTDEIVPDAPKYVEQRQEKKIQKINDIVTPGFIMCSPFEQRELNETNGNLEIQLHKFEMYREKMHMDIEIICNKRNDIPIEAITSTKMDELGISFPSEEKKIAQKYRRRKCPSQIPPNWERREYDRPEDHFNQREIEKWSHYQKEALNFEIINQNMLESTSKRHPLRIRSSSIIIPCKNEITDNSDDSTEEYDVD